MDRRFIDDLDQSATIFKRIFSDALDVFRDHHTYKVVAASESFLAYFGNTCRDSDTIKPGAAAECDIAYCGNIFGQRYTGNSSTTGKCTVINFGHVGYSYVFKILWNIVGIATDVVTTFLLNFYTARIRLTTKDPSEQAGIYIRRRLARSHKRKCYALNARAA